LLCYPLHEYDHLFGMFKTQSDDARRLDGLQYAESVHMRDTWGRETLIRILFLSYRYDHLFGIFMTRGGATRRLDLSGELAQRSLEDSSIVYHALSADTTTCSACSKRGTAPLGGWT